MAELSPPMARLAAQVELGITPAEGREAMLRAIGSDLPEIIVSSIDLAALRRTAETIAIPTEEVGGFERAVSAGDLVAPRNEIERALAGFWRELLGLKVVGVHDNFFDLGGHSLIAVRLFRKIKQAFATDFPISLLFEAPTIAACAERIAQSSPRIETPVATVMPMVAPAPKRFIHLVQMSPGLGGARKPFFFCAGMFGNVLNLRNLAQQLGQSRPIYGLQARGLYGDEPPHETFEDMARSCLAEIRGVQPKGPYLLGGFSGGGLVAYEMAQQLKAEGDEAAIVVMLDTPLPGKPLLSLADRVAMKTQDLRRQGPRFVVNWAKRRIDWERERRRRETVVETATTGFHNELIENAFYRALASYRVRPYAGRVVNMRPRLQPAYRLSGGRMIDEHRSLVREDNGWSPYIPNLEVLEVLGTHDSMVLEPNVRSLASRMRSLLDETGMPAPALMDAAE